jgi:hypothetical protein
MDFDWKTALGKVAPMIGAAVGGPFGGMAASAALSLLDIKPEKGKEEAQLEEAIASMTPEQAMQLKMAEKNWLTTMKELDLKEEDLHAKDRDSARNMQIETNSWVVPTLAIITVLGFFAVVGLILSGKVPLDSTLTGFVLGAVSSKAEQIYNFFFGSSKGSKDKTMHMANKP